MVLLVPFSEGLLTVERVVNFIERKVMMIVGRMKQLMGPFLPSQKVRIGSN